MATLQKQPPRGVPRKRYSENMQQIYRRLPIPKCEITIQHGCSPVNLPYIFRAPFVKDISKWLLHQHITTFYKSRRKLAMEN